MTFIVNRAELVAELSLLQFAMERKGTIPALSMVKMEFDGSLRLTTTDLDVTLQASIAASGSPWSGCLPCGQLFALVRLFGQDEVSFTERPNGRVEVKCGSGKHLLPSLPVSEFPTTPEPCETPITLDSAVLSTMLRSVRFSMLDPNGVVKLQDAMFRGLQLSLKSGIFKVEATRKVTFAMAEYEAKGKNFSVIIPAPAVNALLALAVEDGEITFGTTDKFATFHHGDRTLITRLLIGTFPDFSGIIPEFTQRATVETAALTRALKRAALTTDFDISKRQESVKLTFTANELLIETKGGDSGKSNESLPITSNLNGEAIPFGAFASQLLEWLSTAGDEAIVELAPGLVRLSQTGQKASYIVCGTSLKW